MKTLKSAAMVFFTLIAASAVAQITMPDLLNYQGRLVDGTNLVNGNVEMTFHLWDAPTGSGMGGWPGCTDSGTVSVVDGLYSTYIGDDIVWGSLDNALNQTQVWIEVIVGTNVLTPREQLLPAAYAQYAKNLPANTVKSWHIDSGQIYSYHIPDGEIRGNKLRNGTISNAQIAAGAIYGDRIADGSISNVKYGFESVDLNAIAQNAVQFWHIADGAVRSNHISWSRMPAGLQDGDNDTTYSAGTGLGLAGTTFYITNGAIGSSQLASGAVRSNQIDWVSMPTGLQDGDDTADYQAGSEVVEIWQGGLVWPVDVTFSPAFSVTPIVTLGLNLAQTPGAAASTLITSKSTLGFHVDATAPGWDAEPEGVHDNGDECSIAMVNDRPCISYSRSTKLYFSYRWEGNGQFYAEVADTNLNVGYYSSLAVVDGRPAISYFDNANDNLKYVRADDADGTAWGTPVVVDSAGSVGWMTSLAVVDNRPAIAYMDDTKDHVKYVRATDSSGSGVWQTPVLVSTNGYWPDLKMVNGRPAMSFVDLKDGGLKYIRANDATGGTWGAAVTITSGASTAQYFNAMAIVNGRPAIAFWEYHTSTGAGALKYVRAGDASGTTWGSPQTLFTNNFYAFDFVFADAVSLSVVNGKPAVAFSSYGLASAGPEIAVLKYAYSKDINGDEWLDPITVDTPAANCLYTSLMDWNGGAAIAYEVSDLYFVSLQCMTGTVDWIAVEP